MSALDRLNDNQQFDLALEAVGDVDYGTGRTLQEAINVEYGTDISEEVANTLKVLDMSVMVAEPGDDVNDLGVEDSADGTYTAVREILFDTMKTGGSVFMGVKLNQKKSRVVWDMGRDTPEDKSDNYVVKFDSTEWYDTFSETFGWERLANIDLGNIHKYNISNSEYNSLVTEIENVEENEDGDVSKGRSDPTPPEEEKLNVSVSNKHTEQKKYFAKEIKDQFDAGKSLSVERKSSRYHTQYYDVNTLILFPANSDRKISENYSYGGSKYNKQTVALANCNVSTAEYLSELDNVYTIDEFATDSWRKKLNTSEGPLCVANARDEMVIHLVREETKEAFEKIMDDVPEALEYLYEENANGFFEGRSWSGPDFDEIIYTPMTWGEFFELIPAVLEADVHVMYGGVSTPSMCDGHKSYIKNDVWLYAVARLKEWIETPEMSGMLDRSDDRYELKQMPDLHNGGYELIETLSILHDSGEDPHSSS